jgi:acyl-CoA thioester hydrolase
MVEPEASVHRWALRVYYEDTDAVGIVYHGSYLRFAERARTEMLRALGFDHRSLLRDHGLAFAVRSLEVDYLASAKLDEELNVHTRVEQVGGASVTLIQEVERVGMTIARLRVRLVMLDRRGRAARLPTTLRRTLEPARIGLHRGPSTIVG